MAVDAADVEDHHRFRPLAQGVEHLRLDIEIDPAAAPAYSGPLRDSCLVASDRSGPEAICSAASALSCG